MVLSTEHTFIPRRGLRGAHAQTIAGNFLPRQNLLPPGERRIFTVAEHDSGAKIQVECLCHWQTRESADPTPTAATVAAAGDPGDRAIGSSGEVKEQSGYLLSVEVKTRANDKFSNSANLAIGSNNSKSRNSRLAESRRPKADSPSDLTSPDDPITRWPDPLTLIIVHGLEGSVDSQYVIGTGSKAWAAGMNVVRMNMRNCGNTETLTPTLYHSGLSADVGAVVEELIREDGLERIALVGFSMGGNLVLKLAGEWKDHAPSQVKAVATVSPAMDLAASADALHSWRNWLYEQKFLRGLRNRYRRKAMLFPERYDLAHLRRFASIREFDDKITARYEGFTGADDYYERSSSARVIDQIRIPALVIHAGDDPFIRILPETSKKLVANPAIHFIETQHGGHCAFLAEPNGYDGRWAEKTVVEFLCGL